MEKQEEFEQCPACDRWYDEIDADYQICSKCGFDAEKAIYSSEYIRQPTEDDYMSGDADILTGFWN